MKSAAVIVGCLLAASYCGPGRVKKSETAETNGPVKVYALKYGESDYPSKLVNTASHEKNVRLNWLAYLVEHDNGRRTLIDCGFSDAKLRQRFAIRKFRAVPDILAELKIPATAITTVILTHTHFDHALDVDKFPKATVIVHQDELKTPEEASLKPILALLEASGRVHQVLARESVDGLQIDPVQGHTKGSLVVRYGDRVFTGDECYFEESCRAKIPLPAAAVYSTEANRRFMATLTPGQVILTGHETDLRHGRWLSDYVFFFF